jgi:pimeloyl-ACP methyl ester carboxylesterase
MTGTDWTFNGTWPYEPSWFDTPDGRMHYIDEGPRDGRPVIMVHGNPTWGFLYRNFVGPVVDAGHGAIVVDHLGFGRSDKPDNPELYLYEPSARRLEALLESLDLHEATPVVQDLGRAAGAVLGLAPPGPGAVTCRHEHLRAPVAGGCQVPAARAPLPRAWQTRR